jgi:hypothetical protein
VFQNYFELSFNVRVFIFLNVFRFFWDVHIERKSGGHFYGDVNKILLSSYYVWIKLRVGL